MARPLVQARCLLALKERMQPTLGRQEELRRLGAQHSSAVKKMTRTRR